MIDILLATYNSEKFIEEQLLSILNQDMDDWKLLIRDGGSKDKTLQIISSYCHKYPDRIQLISSSGNSSAVENFTALLRLSRAAYIMFADHDDIWCRDKVKKTFAQMQKGEEKYGIDLPLLVFTDKYIVDQEKKPKASSFFKYSALNPAKTSINQLLVQNVPAGCTMLLNRKLAELALPIPEKAVMHDHWISLVASAFGHISYLDEPTLFYRQHSCNYYGAAKYNTGYFIYNALKGKINLKSRFRQNIEQAAVFLECFEHLLNIEQRELLEEFLKLKTVSGIKAWRILYKYRILKHGFMRNMGMFYLFL
ncbi:glycosyltransferase family 2 protein [Lentisphaerota bacterium ZTH]|nr:glycosyltransferase family 2 protein [Lentisphaerota bacterium]WET06395.1 glycosyltransferase family 2 protein [Lentisphaerota bacterium ZTH]